jgi:dephospho-CoA kinase
MRFDGTILIYASNKLKIQRIQDRDHLSKKEVQLRIQSQLSDKDKLDKVTYTIENNEKKLLIPQLNAIIEQIKMI